MEEEENPFSDEDFMNDLSGSESDPDEDEDEDEEEVEKIDVKMRILKLHPRKVHKLVVSKLPKNFTKKVCLII